MSGIIWATAQYRRDRPGMLLVTEEQSGAVTDVPVQMNGEEPRRVPLAPTPWTAAPGAVWRETADGVWVIPVFRHGD